MKFVPVLLLLGTLISCGGESLLPGSSAGIAPIQITIEPASESDQDPEQVAEPAPGAAPAPTPFEEPAAAPLTVNGVPLIREVSLVSQVPSLSNFLSVSEITNGFELNLASLSSDAFNIEAISDDNDFAGSLLFDLSGPTSFLRFENNAPYTLAPEPANLSSEDGLIPGDYRLVVTPYELPDVQGAVGEPLVISFTVISDEDAVVVSDVPPILGVSVGVFNESTNSFNGTVAIEDGQLIDLTDYVGDSINFLAVSENESGTGSVAFTLTGPDGFEAISRPENFPPFTLERQSVNFLEGGTELPDGQYVLTATPFELQNESGQVGETRQVTFSVVGADANFEQAEVLPAVQTLQANDDTFFIPVSETLSLNASNGVGGNDIIPGSNPLFEVVSEPANGELTLDIDGSFIYTPDDGFTGRDEFVYSVALEQETVTATASINVFGADSGFTQRIPSSDTREVFVSSSTGNDNNTCLTENDPCATIEQGIERMRNGFPDHLLLRRGDTWRIGNRALDGIPSGRSENEPVVISYYGDQGARPTIEGSSTAYRQDRRLVSHLRFLGLRFYGYQNDPENTKEFNPSAGTPDLRFVPQFDDVLIEDCVFEFAEVTVQAFDGNRPSNFTFRRNIFNNSYSNISSFSRSGRRANVFTFGVDGLEMEENVFDFGGWHPTVPGAGANQLSHCVYHQFSSDGNRTTFINNIVSRCAANGIQMRSGGLAQDNFFGRNSIGILMGYNVVPVPSGTTAHVLNNVVSEGEHMSKGVGACDGGATCSSALWGLDIVSNSGADYRVFDNIISMLAPGEDRTGVINGSTTNLTVTTVRNQGPNVRTDIPTGNNIGYRFFSDTQGTNNGFVDPERTLGTYHGSIGETPTYEAFMEAATSRPLGVWDVRYTAREVNAYIRAGFETE